MVEVDSSPVKLSAPLGPEETDIVLGVPDSVKVLINVVLVVTSTVCSTSVIGVASALPAEARATAATIADGTSFKAVLIRVSVV